MIDKVATWYCECKKCPTRISIKVPDNFVRQDVIKAFLDEMGVSVTPYICSDCLKKGDKDGRKSDPIRNNVK